jgi:hypothetical protein
MQAIDHSLPADDIEDDLDELEEEDFLDLEEVPERDDEPPVTPPLKHEEIDFGFRRATTGFSGGRERWAERAKNGLTDEQLAEVLKRETGIFGGQCGPNALGIAYQGSGLKIWIDRGIGSMRRKPVLQGAATVKMARVVYGIRDPDDKQMSLL